MLTPELFTAGSLPDMAADSRLPLTVEARKLATAE